MNATADGGMDRALTAWSIAGVRLSAQVRLPPAARDLIERLLCDVDDRLGTAGAPPRSRCATRCCAPAASARPSMLPDRAHVTPVDTASIT